MILRRFNLDMKVLAWYIDLNDIENKNTIEYPICIIKCELLILDDNIGPTLMSKTKQTFKKLLKLLTLWGSWGSFFLLTDCTGSTEKDTRFGCTLSSIAYAFNPWFPKFTSTPDCSIRDIVFEDTRCKICNMLRTSHWTDGNPGKVASTSEKNSTIQMFTNISLWKCLRWFLAG